MQLISHVLVKHAGVRSSFRSRSRIELDVRATDQISIYPYRQSLLSFISSAKRAITDGCFHLSPRADKCQVNRDTIFHLHSRFRTLIGGRKRQSDERHRTRRDNYERNNCFIFCCLTFFNLGKLYK